MNDAVIPLTQKDKDQLKIDIDLVTHNPLRSLSYHKTLQKHAKECAEKLNPFCTSCAIKDNKNHEENYRQQCQYAIQSGKPIPHKPTLSLNLKKYTDCMQKIGESQTSIPLRKEGHVNAHHTITFQDFKCVNCGSGQSIELTEERANFKKK